MLQSVLKKAYKWGLTSAEEHIDHLFQTRDKAIFSNIMDDAGLSGQYSARKARKTPTETVCLYTDRNSICLSAGLLL